MSKYSRPPVTGKHKGKHLKGPPTEVRPPVLHPPHHHKSPGSKSGNGGGGKNGKGGNTPGSNPNAGTGSTDYSALFSAFGMPPRMIKEINRLMAQLITSGQDPTYAYDTIIGEIRSGKIGDNFKNGESWYAYTYAGISEGVANGLLDSSNMEASYRDYVNQVDNWYKEYFGRNATTDEIKGFLKQGLNLTTVNAQLKGQSYANAYSSGDSNAYGYSWNALLGNFGQLQDEKQLSDKEKLALGESMTGYSTPLGDQLNKQLQTALRRMQTIFTGTLAGPADLQKGGSGLKAPSMAGEVTPDTGPI